MALRIMRAPELVEPGWATCDVGVIYLKQAHQPRWPRLFGGSLMGYAANASSGPTQATSFRGGEQPVLIARSGA